MRKPRTGWKPSKKSKRTGKMVRPKKTRRRWEDVPDFTSPFFPTIRASRRRGRIGTSMGGSGGRASTSSSGWEPAKGLIHHAIEGGFTPGSRLIKRAPRPPRENG